MGISTDLITLLNYLLPGFIAAWVFYGLTSHPRSSPFERTVQAIILTLFIQAVLIALRESSYWIRDSLGISVGRWTTSTEICTSVIIALAIGHLIAYIANSNAYHKLLYTKKITCKTSLVSEWYSAFSQHDCYVILHLDKNLLSRRLLGWPQEWPDDPVNGHFVMTHASWLHEVNEKYQQVPADNLEMILIPSKNVIMVEFVKSESKKDDQTP